jgi:predicted ArsR family transcriptional regulator
MKIIRDPETWRTLVAARRIEIVEAIRLLGPSSIAEIAATIDRPPDTLYRHIDRLSAVGVIREAGTRKRGRHTERLVDLTADDFSFSFADPPDQAQAELVSELAEGMMRTAVRTVRDSAAAGALTLHDRERNLVVNYELGWLTPERFQEVRALVRRLKEIMDDSKPTRQGRLYMSLAIVSPVTRKRRRAERKK